MRILFVNYEYPPLGGGGGVVNAWLAEELAKRHEVTVLTSGAFDLRERETMRGVDIVRCRTWFRREMAVASLPSMATFILGGTRAGRKLVSERDFDVVNTHFALPTGPVGVSLARRRGLPNVLSVHGGDLYDPSKWMSPHRHAVLRSVVRRIVRSSDAVVGQSRNTIENLRRYFDPGAQPKLIPLGIPRPPAAALGRNELGLAADDLVMITIGRLVARKGTDQLIRMLALLEHPQARLVVIGDGPELGELQGLARDVRVASQVTFTGFVSDQRKVDWLAASDVYVSTSQHEGFGLVFLEAMAQGLPVVCYDHGGQTDFLASGVNGSVVRLNDLEGFTSAVRELASDDEQRKSISERNRRDVEQFFIETCARRYEELFASLL
ncbi:MAG TPA: glycosyltransferase family 4 protein [Woeseiaceae bacterium]|nr:glycosyltransferase family 4 protein [Woeseiaceae bacterium]